MRLRNGDWGVRIPFQYSKGAYERIEIRKKNGSIKSQTVKIIWSGNGYSIGVPLSTMRKRRKRRIEKIRQRHQEYDDMWQYDTRRRIEREYGIPYKEADWLFDALGDDEEAAEIYNNIS